MALKLKVTLVKSPLGRTPKQRDTVRSLGLRRIRHSVAVVDSPAIRGMIRQVHHLVSVQPLE